MKTIGIVRFKYGTTKLFSVKIILEKLSSKSIFTFVKVVLKSILETRHKDTFN